MRDIAALLFGHGASRHGASRHGASGHGASGHGVSEREEITLPGPFEPEDGLEDRVRESGAWCGPVPGLGAIRRLSAASRGATRTFGKKIF